MKMRFIMNVLIIGDIVGETGVTKLKESIGALKQQENIDFTIVNGENAGDGMGITIKQFASVINSGVDVVTMGNHTWGKREIFTIIDNPKLIRPANYSAGLPGNGYSVFDINGKKVAVISLIGRVYLDVLSENPFLCVDKILEEIKGLADIIIVDMHAEASAEKIAMGYYLDGRVSAVFGTHTHVQTSDETILENGTAYITDIGMTGPKKSIIGMDVEVAIKRFLTSIPERYKVSTDKNAILNSCVITIDDNTGRALEIKRVNM
jgi:metallophosphoesterase (TIGR00282 family)